MTLGFALGISSPIVLYAKPVWLTYSSGTGFFVTRDGYVLTNNHVIHNCRDITVSGAVAQANAVLVAYDDEYDLALLKTYAVPPDIARLSSMKQPLSTNDPVVIVGYPGQAWQTGKSVMRQANIIDTKGPRGEEKWIEFSDSLQQGNSGGPLLDSAGNVVGVVAAKGRLSVYNETDQREQELSKFDLAISLPVVRGFLDGNDIQYQKADSGIYESPGAITSRALRFVVNVRCRYDEQAALQEAQSSDK